MIRISDLISGVHKRIIRECMKRKRMIEEQERIEDDAGNEAGQVDYKVIV